MLWPVQATCGSIGKERPMYLFDNVDTEPGEPRGKLVRMELVSSNVAYGPAPKWEDEVKQVLVIESTGRGQLARYRFGDGFDEHSLISDQLITLSQEDAERLIAAAKEMMMASEQIAMIRDVGIWGLTLKNDEGKIWNTRNSLHSSEHQERLNHHYSTLFRSVLGINDLILFDDMADVAAETK